MTKDFFNILVFALLLCLCTTQNCVGPASDDLIQTGTVDIINLGTNARQTLAQTPVLYNIPNWGFQVAFSFVDIQYNNSQGIDFTIRGGRIPNSNLLGISLLLTQDRRWERLKVSYLVDSRRDIWVGSFSFSPYFLNNAQNNSGSLSTQVQGAVDGWQPDNNNTVYLKAVFLSGLQTTNSNFSLTLTNVTFDKVRGVVGVTLSNSSRGIDFITISYMISVTPNVRFIIDSFNYPGTISVADYGMIASSGFSAGGISGARYYGINIQSNLLNCQGLCSSPCITKGNCSQLNGISSGNDCIICPNNTRYDATRKTCVPIVASCGANQQLVNGACQCVFGFIKLGEVCVSRCGVNQQWNGTGCVCSRGNANITNVCRPCPTGSVPSANKNTCQCSIGSIFDPDSLRCVPIYQCQNNATGFIEGGVYRCKCNADFYANGNNCVYCPAPALWNTSSLSCYCPNVNQNFNGTTCISCGSGQYWNAATRKCQCFSPRVLVLGQCKCPNNLLWNNQTNKCECQNKFQALNSTSNTCVCASPYIKLQTGQCGLVCPQNEWWSAGECKCKSPFVRINGKCTMNCSVNQKWNGIQCACVQNYFRINGTCTTCPVGMFYNATAKACQNLCALNEVLNGTLCVCRQNFYRINSVCSQCPIGTGYRPSTGICVSCDQNEIQSNSLCVCKLNFYRINGVCGQCPSGTSYNADKQSCDPLCTGANQVYDGKNCVCAPNFNRINGVCTQCVAGTAFNSVNQVCQSICKINEVFTNGLCNCITNFYRINGVCGQCPTETTYNQNSQTCNTLCKVNQTFDGTKCVCISGYFVINGICDTCSAGTYYDDTIKRCARQPTCPAGAQWNQTRLQCICTIANQFLINGTCQACGNNSAWNGSRCVCRSGFFLIGGECLTCDLNSSYNTTSRTCICNRGFYGDRTLCQKCDSTCGRCSGPSANQCLDCVDVSYTISNGVCSKPTNCVSGMYLSGSICKPCSAYCSSCKDQNTCTQCTSGFSLSSVVLTPTLTYFMCQQICGDGKRYQYTCDDGNTNNGDGCSDQCQVQNGWSCSGGTTTSKSVCMKLIPTRSIITPKGAVQLSGKVMQGITVSYLPDALTAGGCPKCSQVLLISIIQAQVIPSFRVNFLPTTQYKYLVEFDFQGIFGIPPFTITIKINPDYAKFFSTQDMAQQITLTVDPAVLAIGQQVEDLTIQQILGQKIAIADGDLNRVFN